MKMDSNLALKVNKFIHEQCIDGTPHDIGWNVVKLIQEETGVELTIKPTIGRCIHCGESKEMHTIHSSMCLDRMKHFELPK